MRRFDQDLETLRENVNSLKTCILELINCCEDFEIRVTRLEYSLQKSEDENRQIRSLYTDLAKTITDKDSLQKRWQKNAKETFATYHQRTLQLENYRGRMEDTIRKVEKLEALLGSRSIETSSFPPNKAPLPQYSMPSPSMSYPPCSQPGPTWTSPAPSYIAYQPIGVNLPLQPISPYLDPSRTGGHIPPPPPGLTSTPYHHFSTSTYDPSYYPSLSPTSYSTFLSYPASMSPSYTITQAPTSMGHPLQTPVYGVVSSGAPPTV